MAHPAPPQPAQPQDGGLLSNPIIRQGLQAFAIYWVVSSLFGKKAADQPPAAPSNLNHDPSSPPPSAPVRPQAPLQEPPAIPLWPRGTPLDVTLKLSALDDDEARDNVHRVLEDQSLPGVTWEGVEWSNTGWKKVWETEWNVPETVQHNASLYLDIFLTRAGSSPDPSSPSYPADSEVLHTRKTLTRYMPQRRIRATKNLLSGSKSTPASTEEDEQDEQDEEASLEGLFAKASKPIVSFYHPNVSLEIVCDSGAIPYANLPPPVKQHVQLAKHKTYDGKSAYLPPLFVNDFWLLKEHMNPINETTPRLPLRVEFKPTSHFKFQIMTTMDDAISKQAASTGAGSGAELDAVKSMLLDTNPILLITTFVVSILHMLFEFLAFTSDVKHWRGKKELVGVSVRTIVWNVITQLIVLLYLLDSSEETSTMILFSSGIGLLIEAWKISKAVDVRIVGYKIQIKDKHVLTEDEKATQEYDKLAYKYVGWGMGPLLVGYTIYSLFYNEHKSWWSFTITTLTSFVQTMGFVQLVPQLIINYKLKSVAHIPMKAMGYKVLSTVIDDFFSFIIKMPLLHRLACFRDDVVFVILVYQMWIYRVDYTRENEYGQKLTEEEAARLLRVKEQAERDEREQVKEDADEQVKADVKGKDKGKGKGKGKKEVKETKKTQ
ncbi:hypothetical protein JCM21900_001106 [Sporobolomyces salmonicolor]